MMVVRKVASVWLIVLGFSAFSAGDAVAESITGVTIEDYSSRYLAQYGPVYIIDGSGLNETTGTHVTSPANAMWFSAGASGTGTRTDYDPYIKFDLGGQFDLESVRIWNYNDGGFTNRSVKGLDILGSPDNVTYTLMKTVEVAEAPGVSTYDFSETFSSLSNASNVRYVMFDILSTYEGTVFPTNEEGGNVGGIGIVGLSEVRFDGILIPEPSTLALLAIGSLGLLLCRFRGRSAK